MLLEIQGLGYYCVPVGLMRCLVSWTHRNIVRDG